MRNTVLGAVALLLSTYALAQMPVQAALATDTIPTQSELRGKKVFISPKKLRIWLQWGDKGDGERARAGIMKMLTERFGAIVIDKPEMADYAVIGRLSAGVLVESEGQSIRRGPPTSFPFAVVDPYKHTAVRTWRKSNAGVYLVLTPSDTAKSGIRIQGTAKKPWDSDKEYYFGKPHGKEHTESSLELATLAAAFEASQIILTAAKK